MTAEERLARLEAEVAELRRRVGNSESAAREIHDLSRVVAKMEAKLDVFVRYNVATLWTLLLLLLGGVVAAGFELFQR